MSLSQIMDKSKPGMNLVVNSIITTEPLDNVCNSLQTLSGDIAMVSPQNTISISIPNTARRLGATSTSVQNIEFESNSSLNGLINGITLISPDSSITIVPNAEENTIELQAVGGGGGGVSSLNLLTGAVSLASPGDTITFNTEGQTINIEAIAQGVQSVSAGSGGVSITGTATDPIVNIPAIPPSTLVISDYTSTAGTLALTGTFAAQGSTTLTTTLDSAPINVFGTLNLLHPGGGADAVIEARIVIGTTPQQVGPTITQTIASGHYEAIPLIYKGVGPTTAGNVNILLQARVITNAVNRVSAQVMAIGQMNNA